MPASRIRALAIASAALITIMAPACADAAPSSASTTRLHKAGYANPLAGEWYATGPTDMGVDFCLRPGPPSLAPTCADAGPSRPRDTTLHKARDDTGYVNPLGGDWYETGRTDMGVDFCLRPGAPIRAVGDGVVVGISPGWFDQEPYIWYRLTDGPDAGRYIYVAEQISTLTRVGARIGAGQPLADYRQSGTCIEMGWSAANGATLAQATTGYDEGQVTSAGVSFAHFLGSLGIRGLSA